LKAKEFYNIYRNKSFQLGQVDCFRMIYDYMSYNMNVPEEYEGLTLENYSIMYKENPDQAIQLMLKFCNTYLIKKKDYEFIAGDILIIEEEKTHIVSPAILLANTNILIVTKNGVTIAPLEAYKIRGCYTCHK